VSYLERYRLFGEASTFKRDRRFFLRAFVGTLVASVAVVVWISATRESGLGGTGLGIRLAACAGANLFFWLFWYGVYRLGIPAIVPSKKLRAFVKRDDEGKSWGRS
jgi:hypothetical protein